jgi:Ceramidase
MNRHLKIWMLAGIAVVTAAIVFCLKPVPQDPAFHRFADTRDWLGVPNFWNVTGNVCFLLVGVWGWMELIRRRVWTGGRVIYGVLFGGIFLTGLGSAYYHWNPDNDRLIWDRIPMTVVFMSLLAAVIGEWVDRKAALWLLGPLVAVGVFSVLWWHHTEALGRGDLRLYGWVQFFPALAIVLILVMFGEKGKRAGVRSLVWVVVWYAVAKVLEYFDRGLFSMGGVMSGHALKHVAAAVSTAHLVQMFRERYELN